MTQIKLKFTGFYFLAFKIYKRYSIFFKQIKHSLAKLYSLLGTHQNFNYLHNITIYFIATIYINLSNLNTRLPKIHHFKKIEIITKKSANHALSFTFN